MTNSQEDNAYSEKIAQENADFDNHVKEKEEVSYELEEDNLAESLIRNVIKGYQEAWNKNSEKNEIKFSMTITSHKVATPDGNKDVAYLRLDRSIREKGPNKMVVDPNDPTKLIVDEGWETKLLHQEVHFFRGIKERVDPRKMWKEQLYVNALARLVAAGLEYAELLQRLKPAKDALQAPKPENETQDRLNKIGLVTADQMPKALTKEEQDYAEWAKKNSEYGK